MPDGVVYGTADNKVISLNPGAERIFAVTTEEAKGRNIEEFITVTIIGRPREVVSKELMAKGEVRIEAEVTNRLGEKYIVLATIKRFSDLNGKITGWISVYTDISPLRLNDELKAANNYLEQLAFISAHDIKSPIVSLAGLTDMLSKSTDLTAKDRQILELVQGLVTQMNKTNKGLNEILKLRKNLTDGYAQPTENKTLEEILQAVRNLIDADIEKCGAQLNIELNGFKSLPLPAYYMQSVFQNLLSNAIKYRDPQRPLVISVTATPAANGIVQIAIADNGKGFNMEHNRDRVFGIFKRFHNDVEGAGVGLHIVKSIIEAYGGNITVNSRQNVGTTFVIELRTA